jgi:hypothetical protein
MDSANLDVDQLEIPMENFIKHYGVAGMKWGVRNKSTVSPKYSKSEDHVRARDLKRKPISSLSNAEIKFLNERLNLEQNVNRLNPNKVKKGRDTVKEIVATVGVVTSVVGLANSKYGKAMIEFGKKIMLGDRFNDMVSIP